MLVLIDSCSWLVLFHTFNSAKFGTRKLAAVPSHLNHQSGTLNTSATHDLRLIALILASAGHDSVRVQAWIAFPRPVCVVFIFHIPEAGLVGQRPGFTHDVGSSERCVIELQAEKLNEILSSRKYQRRGQMYAEEPTIALQYDKS